MLGINKYGRELNDQDLDRNHHRTYVGGMWEEIGELQFRYLCEQGLMPHHRLLDIGCGALRGGLHFVRYLDTGNYAGLDVNRSLIAAGHRELAAAGLDDQNATLVVDDRFDFSQFGASFDFMLAVSVFTHLPSEIIETCLKSAGRHLVPGGTLYATVFLAEPGVAEMAQDPGGITTYSDHDPFHYTVEALAALADRAGLQLESVSSWNHPRAQQMAAFRHRNTN